MNLIYSRTVLAVFLLPIFITGCVNLNEGAPKPDFHHEIKTLQDMTVLGVYKLGEYIKIYPSDSTCLLASQQGHLYMFNITTGKILWERGIEGVITHVSASQDCSKIAVGTQQIPRVYLFNRTGALEWEYGLTGNVNQLTISGAGNLIAVGFGYPESKVYLIDNQGRPVFKHQYGKIETSINSISTSYYGRYAAVGTGFRHPAITFFENNSVKWEYKVKSKGTPVSGVHKVKLTQDGDFGLAITENKAYFFNKNGILYAHNGDSDIKSVTLASQEKFAAIGTVKGELSFFNRTGRLWSYNTNHSVDLLKISKDGDFLVTVSGKNVLFFNRTGVHWIKEFEDADIIEAVISEDSVLIYVRSGFGENISLVDREGKTRWSYIIPEYGGKVEHYMVFNGTVFIAIKNRDKLLFSRAAELKL